MAAVIIVLLILNFVVSAGGIDHADLDARLTVVEYETRFQSCMERIMPTNRTPARIAECQAAAVID